MNNKECTRLAVGNKAGQKRIGVGWVYGPSNWDASPSAGLYLTQSQSSLTAALDRTHSDVKGSDATVTKLNSPGLFVNGSKGFLSFSIHTKLL